MSFTEFFSKGFLGHIVWSSDAGVAESTRIICMAIGILVTVIAAYLLGSLNFAIIISGKKYKQAPLDA